MRSISVFTLLALLLTQSITSASPAKHTSATPSFPNVVLTGKAAAQLLKPCSRAAPTSVSGYWTPTVNDIKQLENNAPAFVNRQTKKHCYSWSEIACQYAGCMQRGRRVIYANCVSRDFIAMVRQQKSANGGQGLDWQHHAFVFADGTPLFFSMEYDVQAHQFHYLSFNGRG